MAAVGTSAAWLELEACITPRVNNDDFERPMANGLESLASAREVQYSARKIKESISHSAQSPTTTSSSRPITLNTGNSFSSSNEEYSDDEEYYTADFTSNSYYDDDDIQLGWVDESMSSCTKPIIDCQEHNGLSQPPHNSPVNDSRKSKSDPSLNDIELRLSFLLESKGLVQSIANRAALEPMCNNTTDNRREELGHMAPKLNILKVKDKTRNNNNNNSSSSSSCSSRLKRVDFRGEGGLDQPSQAALLFPLPITRPVPRHIAPLNVDLSSSPNRTRALKPCPPSHQNDSITNSPISTQRKGLFHRKLHVPHQEAQDMNEYIEKKIPQLQLMPLNPNYGWAGEAGSDSESYSSGDGESDQGSISSARSTASSASGRARIMNARAFAAMERIEGTSKLRRASPSSRK